MTKSFFGKEEVGSSILLTGSTVYRVLRDFNDFLNCFR